MKGGKISVRGREKKRYERESRGGRKYTQNISRWVFSVTFHYSLHINHACLHAWQEYASQLCLWLVQKTRLGLINHSVYPDPNNDSHN